jgi:putative Mn2+ efflux pump MntP
MQFLELIIIAVGVSMDAFAVSICKGLSVRRLRPKYMASAALWFGGFQALMPLIGYFVGLSFADLVADVDHWIAFVLLGVIGGKMIKEACQKDEDCDYDPDFSFKTMFLLAVATSIDALAVGVSFAFLRVDIWTSILVIGLMTGAFSALGVVLGYVFGCRFKSKAEFIGGLILVAMGIKILLEHII